MTTDNLDDRNPNCKIITILSEKGGSGKTSLAYLLASAALSRGKRVHCIDADRNPQLLTWRGTTQAAHPDDDISFPSSLTASKLPDNKDLYDQHIAEMSNNADVVIIDTRPGRYEDTEDIAYSSDVILIPGMPRAGDIKLLGDTVLWMLECRDAFVDLEYVPPIRVAMLNAPLTIIRAIEDDDVDSLTDADYGVLGRFADFPYLETVVQQSRVIEFLSQNGPLDGYISRLSGGHRAAARRIAKKADQLLDEVLSLRPEKSGKSAKKVKANA